MSLVLSAGIALAAATPALAEELVAVKPGVMCSSGDALGKLTLPGGDSRTHAAWPKQQDEEIAAAGGCIDILLGATVTVQKAFKNTATVSYDGAAFTVPIANFQPATKTAAGRLDLTAIVPPDYSITQRVPTGDHTLVLLEDRRITPMLRQQMWRRGEPDIALEPSDALYQEFQRQPLLNARLILVSSTGTVTASKQLDKPLATLEPAPLSGLSTPTFLLTVDYSTGMGGFSGPDSELLTPAERQLNPVEAINDHGQSAGTIDLGRTLHTGWQIVPSRHGGTEEIEEVSCLPGRGQKTLQTYQTYRYDGSHWTVTSRQHGECGEIEVFPPRREFP